MSIYDRSGIIARFEARFAEYHGRKHALLNSSGTASLLAMYFAAGLGPDDEVICPTYTFHATASPLVLLGARPVFCDCGSDGNVNPELLDGLVSPRTKAIVVTHMWGIPCDLDPIVAFARRRSLRLFEDCSHAHGARYKGRLTGTFGDAAVWSLQGQKTISGGEGGVLLTDDPEIHYRALLLGHYNKRCKQEIPTNHPAAAFALTGFGLKLRAHPLAIAIADCLLDDLDEILARRHASALCARERLAKHACLRFPAVGEALPSWYAFPFLFDSSELRIDTGTFHAALVAEGLAEVDRPSSTRPIHGEPLFLRPSQAVPWASDPPVKAREFPMAEYFHQHCLKMPVWSNVDELDLMALYCDGIEKVIEHGEDLEPQI